MSGQVRLSRATSPTHYANDLGVWLLVYRCKPVVVQVDSGKSEAGSKPPSTNGSHLIYKASAYYTVYRDGLPRAISV